MPRRLSSTREVSGSALAPGLVSTSSATGKVPVRALSSVSLTEGLMVSVSVVTSELLLAARKESSSVMLMARQRGRQLEMSSV